MPNLINETGAGRLFERVGKRAIFLAVGAGQSGYPAQVILGLIAVALFDLPEPIILPGLDVAGVRLERALIPDLRDLVVAELAIGIADQVGDRGGVIAAKRLQLFDGRSVVVLIVDRGVGCPILLGECRVLCTGADFAGLLLGFRLGRGGRRRRWVVIGCGVHNHRGRDQRQREACQRQYPDSQIAHSSLLGWVKFEKLDCVSGNDRVLIGRSVPLADPTPSLSTLNTLSTRTFPSDDLYLTELPGHPLDSPAAEI